METADEFYAYFKELLGDLYDEYDFENLVQVLTRMRLIPHVHCIHWDSPQASAQTSQL